MLDDKPKGSPQRAILKKAPIPMNKKQLEIAETFFRYASSIPFGTASVELKIHAGKCVGITYTTSENTRQKENEDGVLD
jgi:hypothetical protein